jgi:hypothetical protein
LAISAKVRRNAQGALFGFVQFHSPDAALWVMNMTRGQTTIDGRAVRMEYTTPPPSVELSPVELLLPHIPPERITQDDLVRSLSALGEVLSVHLFFSGHHLTARVRFAGRDCARVKAKLSTMYPDVNKTWEGSQSRPSVKIHLHDEAHSIFVGGLYPAMYHGLMELFSTFGEIEHLQVFAHRAKPFAFIRYMSPTSATNAVTVAGSASNGRVSRFQRKKDAEPL